MCRHCNTSLTQGFLAPFVSRAGGVVAGAAYSETMPRAVDAARGRLPNDTIVWTNLGVKGGGVVVSTAASPQRECLDQRCKSGKSCSSKGTSTISV